MFSSGAGVEVVENSGHLTARVYLPWTYIVSLSVLDSLLSFQALNAIFFIIRIKRVVYLVIGVGTWRTILRYPMDEFYRR